MFQWLNKFNPFAATEPRTFSYEELFQSASDANIISAYPDDDGTQTIADKTALRMATVYRCVEIIANSVADMPLHLLDHSGDSETAERIHDHPILSLLDRPNEWQTGSDFRKYMTTQLLLRGNAYAYIQGSMDSPNELWPLRPDEVSVQCNSRRHLTYYISPSYGPAQGRVPATEVQPDKIIHLRGLSLDGITGLSVLQCARLAIIHSLNADAFGATLYKNKNTPGGVLSMKEGASLTAERAKNLKEQLDKSKRDKAHGTLILEDGMKWQQVSMTPNDAQFIETRKFQRSEIAMFFGVPPHMLGDVERSTSFGRGIEQQSIGFVNYTLNTYLTCWEQVLALRLLMNQPQLKFKHNTSTLLRGDIATRTAAYMQMRQMGVLSANEIRAMEGWGPRDDGQGDEYTDVPAGGAANMPTKEGTSNDSSQADPEMD